MTGKAKRGSKEGLGFGVIAGIIFAVAEVVAASILGNPLLTPFRAFASILLGQSAMQAASVVVLGSIVHLVLSGVFGLIYGLINAGFSPRTETSWGRQIGVGLAFGAAVWLANFQIIARIGYPWFLTMPQFAQLVIHALCFGLPLALMYVAAERRAQHIVRSPAHV